LAPSFLFADPLGKKVTRLKSPLSVSVSSYHYPLWIYIVLVHYGRTLRRTWFGEVNRGR